MGVERQHHRKAEDNDGERQGAIYSLGTALFTPVVTLSPSLSTATWIPLAFSSSPFLAPLSLFLTNATILSSMDGQVDDGFNIGKRRGNVSLQLAPRAVE